MSTRTARAGSRQGAALFTPGPWKVEYSDKDLMSDIKAKGGKHVAKAYWLNGKLHANANLIVAAPEMLEVLQTNLKRADELIDRLSKGEIEDEAVEFRQLILAVATESFNVIKLATEGRAHV